MKVFSKIFVSIIFIIIPLTSKAADVVDGWSGEDSIKKILSTHSSTYFKLASNTTGCGRPDHWELKIAATDDSNNIKHSLLLAAYMSGKTVNLRCETSKVTDFEIIN